MIDLMIEEERRTGTGHFGQGLKIYRHEGQAKRFVPCLSTIPASFLRFVKMSKLHQLAQETALQRDSVPKAHSRFL